MAEAVKPEKNSTFALWIYTSVLHTIVGVIFLLVGNSDFSFTHITRAASSLSNQVQNSINSGDAIQSVQNVTIPALPPKLTLLFYLGLAHFLVTLLLVLVMLVGNLIKPKVLSAMKFVGILQSLLCIGTTVAIETVLSSYHEDREYLYTVRMGSKEQAPETFSSLEHLTIVDNAGLIITSAALTISIISGVAFVAACSNDDPLPGIYLSFPISILTATTAGNLIFASSSVQIIILGSVWAVTSVLIDFVGSLDKYIGVVASKILTAVLFFILFLFAGAICYLFYSWIALGKKYDTYTAAEINELGEMQRLIYKYYYLLGTTGSFLVSALLQAAAICILSLCVSAFIFYDANQSKKKNNSSDSE